MGMTESLRFENEVALTLDVERLSAILQASTEFFLSEVTREQ